MTVSAVSFHRTIFTTRRTSPDQCHETNAKRPASADQMIAFSPFSPLPVATSATSEQNIVSTGIPTAAASATAAESDSLDIIENGLLMAVCLADRCTFGKWLLVFGRLSQFTHKAPPQSLLNSPSKCLSSPILTSISQHPLRIFFAA